MSTVPRGPHTLKGALVSIDLDNPIPKVVAFQYNPEQLRRTLQPQMVGGEQGERSEAVRFTSAPVETISVEASIDAADQLEKGDNTASQVGIRPQLAALEVLIYPKSTVVTNRQNLLATGIIEIAPYTAPRLLFVWGSRRVLPVRLSEFTITEEAFDTNLNPIRATVSLSMRVLNYSDLAIDNPGYYEFLAYQQNLELLAGKAPTNTAAEIGGRTS